jgi:hypothetical protein
MSTKKNIPWGEFVGPMDPDAPACPYCGNRSIRITGADLYPHRPDLSGKKFYQCAPCDAYVGCHDNSGKPFGTLADKKTREARNRAHAAFDRIWKGGFMTRNAAYSWLAKSLAIKGSRCHISMMDADECERVCTAVKEMRAAD